jgi:hypothetical protein
MCCPAGHRLLFFLVLACICLQSGVTHASPATPLQSASSQPKPTELIQQSQYQKRVDQERKARSEEETASVATPPEAVSNNYDSVVLIILVLSAVTLIILGGRKGGARLRL